MPRMMLSALSAIMFPSILAFPSNAGPLLFESRQLTPTGEYPMGIEGPAVDVNGDLFVVNFKSRGTIGVVRRSKAVSELFATLPTPSIGNGIRFNRLGEMFVADYKGHNIFKLEAGNKKPVVYFHSKQFHQPNDLAIIDDSTLVASDPDFRHGTGQIWLIRRGEDGIVRGWVMTSARKMGVTNGIDLSPDGSTIYVSESNTREIWAYEIRGTALQSPRKLAKFSTGELDGLRTDVDGRIFVARPGAGTIAILTSEGERVREVTLGGKNPTNLTFGGEDGKTVFVTQGSGGFIEAFLSDRPGRSP